MIEMNVDLFGLDDVTRRLLWVQQDMEDRIPGAISRTCEIGAEMVTGYAPVSSGALAGDIGFSAAERTGTGWEGRVGVGLPYGRRRLDLGYRGTDSMNRSYNDPAHPAFGVVAPQLPGILIRELKR